MLNVIIFTMQWLPFYTIYCHIAKGVFNVLWLFSLTFCKCHMIFFSVPVIVNAVYILLDKQDYSFLFFALSLCYIHNQ